MSVLGVAGAAIGFFASGGNPQIAALGPAIGDGFSASDLLEIETEQVDGDKEGAEAKE